MIKYNNTNNASTTLTAGISPSSTTLIVENGDILPTAPFLLTLEHFDNEKVTVREIVKCIAKAGNILTIQRGAGTCVQDDSATPKAQNNTPHSFSVGDCASIYWTSEQVNDIQNEIEKKLNIDDFQAGTYVYGATSTGTDAYSITIPGTLTSYSVGQVFRFMADVDNEGNATLNVNGLGAVEILKNHDQHLQSGDIEAGQIVEVAYDGTNFQMDSQVATVVDITSAGNTQYKNGVAGEKIEEGDVCCTIDFGNEYFGRKIVGQTEASVDYEVIGNGVSSNSITLWLGRRGNTSGEDLVIELIDTVDNVETVIASSTVARSGLTEDTTVETVCSWGESVTTEKGKIYTLRLRTNDNAFDADKGFYYNRTDTDAQHNYFIDSYYEYGNETTFSGNENVPADIPFRFSSGYNTSGGRYLSIVGTNNSITVSYIRNVNSQTFSNLTINGVNVSGNIAYASSFIWFNNNKVKFGGTMYDIPDDNYTITTSKMNSLSNPDGLYKKIIVGINQEYQKINYNCDSLNNILFYKGFGYYIFVNTFETNKGDDIKVESGGLSSIIIDNKKRCLSYEKDGVSLGKYDLFGQLKYDYKLPIPFPAQNTDFYLLKDAIMVCSFSSDSNTLKQDGADYKFFRRGGAGSTSYNNSLAETVEWTLEGGHTYQIDFNPNKIKEFYYVD